MSIKARLLGALLLMLSYFNSYAQEEVVLDQNPPSIQWKQINTPAFKIIFPEDFEREAQRMANTMQHVYGPVSRSLGVKPKKLSLILQNQTSVSNGFVTVAPRRSEFFTMPPQDYNFIGTNDWLNLLAVHEFRHVAQFQKSLTGFTWFTHLIFGGDFWSFVSNVAVPNWFWEGDAVATETALSPSGRGRIPNFDIAFRTSLLERGAWTYHKQYLGSFKDYIPSYYVLGYYMVTHGRRNYGSESWPYIFKKTFNHPYIPFNFSRNMKKRTGYPLLKTYSNMIHEVDSMWSWQIDRLETTESNNTVYRKNTVFTSYKYPQFLSDGKIVALKTGLGNIAQLVIVDSLKSSEKVRVLGMVNDAGILSIGSNKIVWTEFAYDPRWSVRTYSVIKIYDYKTNKVKVLTKKSRLGGASISPDGKKIVAVENATSGENTIIIFDAISGKEIKRLENPENNFFSMARWSDDGKHIVILKTNPQGKTISQISVDDWKIKDLLPFSHENIGHPVQYKDYVFYNSPFSGIDNIYVLDLKTGIQYQVTSKLYGAYNPTISPDGNTIAFNNFTRYGMDVETMPLKPNDWIPLKQVEDRNVKYYQPLVEQEGNEHILTNIPKDTFEVKKYSQFKNLINPYSLYLIPSYITPFIGPEIGVSVRSQNILSTAYADLGISFNGNERRPYTYAGISYQGFFPIIDIKGSIGSRAVSIDKDGKYSRDSIYTWLEKSATIGLRVPLNFTRNKYIKRLEVGANTSITKVSNQTVPEGYTIENIGLLNTAEYSVSYYSLLKQSVRDVTSRWGFSTSLSYQHTPFKLDYSGSLLATKAKLYLPGFLKHDGLQVKVGAQFQEVASKFIFKTPLKIPKGYNYTVYNQLFIGTAEYKFPIWNADVHLGSILNFQRFKGKVFYDRAIGMKSGERQQLESFGAELHTDFNLLRWYPLLEVGVRWTYVPEFQTNYFDFLLFQFNL